MRLLSNNGSQLFELKSNNTDRLFREKDLVNLFHSPSDPLLYTIGAAEFIKTFPYLSDSSILNIKAGILKKSVSMIKAADFTLPTNEICYPSADFLAAIYCYNSIGDSELGLQAKRAFRVNLVKIYATFYKIKFHTETINSGHPRVRRKLDEAIRAELDAKVARAGSISEEEFKSEYHEDILLWPLAVNVMLASCYCEYLDTLNSR